jgi:NAD(P)-dependent dehydrogenase (short-subunit alcohol dehydrogenase family)
LTVPCEPTHKTTLEISAMDLRLQGKRALVTGSSIGLGEAIARALAAEGVAVAIHGRQPKRTYAVAADIEAHGGRVAVVLGDLTVEGEAQNIADSAIEQLVNLCASQGCHSELAKNPEKNPGTGTHSLQQLSSSPTVLTRFFGLLRVTQCALCRGSLAAREARGTPVGLRAGPVADAHFTRGLVPNASAIISESAGR